MTNKKYLNMYIFFIISLFIALALVFVVLPRHENINEDTLKSYNTGWTYSDGTKTNISDLNMSHEDVIFSKKVHSSEVSGESLCFRSKNIFFSVYLDNKLVYEFYPDIPRFCGKSYGQCFHYVSIPDFTGEKVLTISANPIYYDSSCFFDSMYMGNGGAYVQTQLTLYLPKFIIGILILLIGVVMILTGISVRSYKINNVAVISIGIFAVLGALWTSTETMIPQIMTGKSTAIHMLNYYSLILMAIPFIISISEIIGNRNNKCIPTIFVLSVSNFILDTTLTILDISDYHRLLTLIHGVLLISMVMSFYLIIQSIIHKTTEKKSYYVLGTAFTLVMCGGVVDLVRYNLNESVTVDTGVYSRIGILCFILVLGQYSMSNIIEMIKLGQNAEIIRKIAYTDALTGISNRMAFIEDESKFTCSKDGEKIAFIQFDINNLKKVNDVYGHDAGDKHIKAGAEVISESFGAYGKCYRVGGDEFIAVICGDDTEQNLSDALNKMDELINKYNQKSDILSPLEIAYGSAFCDGNGKTAEEAEREADRLMYEKKKQMKSK